MSLTTVLRYPFHPTAVAAHTAYLSLHFTADLLLPALPPLVAGVALAVAHVALWIGWFRYATECMATTAQGRDTPPEVLSEFGADTHLRHSWIHLMLLLGVFVAGLREAQYALLAALVYGLVVPGVIVTLAIHQGLASALLPLNWLIVAVKIGPLRYLSLSAAWCGVALLVSGTGTSWISAPPPPALVLPTVANLLVQAALLALFRWTGLILRAHAEALGLEPSQPARPALWRERETQALDHEVEKARALDDPKQRVQALREVVQRGADDSVHHEYRRALRKIGDRAALDAHAKVRASELIALGRVEHAAALTIEALGDDPGFTLPEAELLQPLLELLIRRAQYRTAAALAANYARSFPRRGDALALAEQAARLWHERLGCSEQAIALLDQLLAEARDPERAAVLSELRRRIEATRASSAPPAVPPAAQ